MDIMRTNDQINMRRPFKELVLPFLGHTAGNGNNQILIAFFQMLELADFPQGFALSRFADAARIEQNHVGHIHIFRHVVSQCFQLSSISLTVRHIRLTAVTNNMIKFIALKIHVYAPFSVKFIKSSLTLYNTIYRLSKQYIRYIHPSNMPVLLTILFKR